MPEIGIADKTTLDLVNAKVGTSADGSGVASLFGKLAAILADITLIKGYTDQVEGYTDTIESLIGTANPASGDLTTLFRGLKLIADYVDTLETKVGANTDGAGTTTLFARLAQIAAYVDTLETLMGNTGDGSGVASVFGRFDLLAGYVDTLENNLGYTGDAANAGGTVLARLAELLNNRLTTIRAGNLDRLDANVSTRMREDGTPYYRATSQTVSAGATIDTITVNGSGCLDFLYAYTSVSGMYWEMWIDGVRRINTATDATAGDGGILPRYGNHLPGPMKFTSSFVIKCVNTTGSGQGYTTVVKYRIY